MQKTNIFNLSSGRYLQFLRSVVFRFVKYDPVSYLEFDIVRVLLDLDALGIGSSRLEQKVLDLFDFTRHFGFGAETITEILGDFRARNRNFSVFILPVLKGKRKNNKAADGVRKF